MQVLVIDDEPAVRQILAAAVAKGGHTVDQAATVAEARAKLAKGDVDVALCDIKLPDGSGLDLLRESRAGGLETPFVMITAFASVDTAVEALRAGAEDFITKPVHTEEILHRLEQIRTLGGLREENRVLRQTVTYGGRRLYRYTAPVMQEVDRLVRRVAPTDSTVLITGESGTGKGVLTRRLHEQSARRAAPFVSINCSAIPEQLLESELFGHTKGAFTSADHAHKGLFVQAEGGTLFLDEIGDMPLHMQSKLLHAIEEKEFRPLGSERSRRVDTRIVAATNRDLVEMARLGKFREDLYFRLSMFQIRLPPLRELRSDLPALVRFLLSGDSSSGSGHSSVEIDPLAEEILLAYPWPGNVRELDNVLNRARILAEDNRIAVGDLPSDIIRSQLPVADLSATATLALAGAPPVGPLRELVRNFEADLLVRTVEQYGGDRRLAAHHLGISLSTLYRKLEEYERT